VSIRTVTLKEEWIQRLGDGPSALLLDDLDRFPELRDAATPPEFKLEPFEDSYLGTNGAETQGQLSGRLKGSADVGSDELGSVDIEFDTRDRLLVIHTLDIPPSVQARGLGSLVVGQLFRTR
jgi:hypothetical protein